MHGADIGDGKAAQRLGLWQIGGQHGGNRQKAALQRLGGFRHQQRVSALGDHHRVRHQRQASGTGGDFVTHGFNRRAIGQHPGFQRIRAQIIHYHRDLLAQELQRHGQYAMHAQRVLRSERRDGCHAEGAKRGHGLQVRLNTGAAT